MPALDDLRRKLSSMIPNWLSQQPAMEPNAYSRIGHTPMMILPEDQFSAASSRAGYSTPPEGFTPSQQDSSGILDYFRSPAVRGMLQQMKQGPVVMLQKDKLGAMPHEITHGLLGNVNQNVLGVLPRGGEDNLFRMDYRTPQKQANEVPSRLLDDTQGYGMGFKNYEERLKAKDAMLKMLPPGMASQYNRLWLSKNPPPTEVAQRNTDVNQQQPSNQF